MTFRVVSSLLILCLTSSVAMMAAKKKKKEVEEITQSLETLKDPPAAVVADASKLIFFLSPLSAKGLLSQQVRDGLKSLMSQSRGAHIVKIRAFVAGSGDMRRVPAIVSEMFTDKKQPLPAVTVVQVGGLPLTGAQVLMEAAAVDKKSVNPNGLAFISGVQGKAKDAAESVTSSVTALGLQADSVRQVTCFLNSLEYEGEVRTRISSAFPRAAAAFVQLRRDSAGEMVTCQSVAALAETGSPNIQGQTALVGPVRIVLTGSQMGFGRETSDVRLALDRLGKALESAGASWRSVLATDTYALSGSIRPLLTKETAEIVSAKRTSTGTALLFEGLPSLDASFAIEAIAFVER